MRITCIAELDVIAGETTLVGAYGREIVETGDDIVDAASGVGLAYAVVVG